jgi:ubiquinone/menaquinone biosynthesis C-methylase UbiE
MTQCMSVPQTNTVGPWAILSVSLRLLDLLTSVLDVGAGTGRAMSKLKTACPKAKVVGVEPVAALREIGYSKGLSTKELLRGDVLQLSFDDDAFDYVIETGVLHHVYDPTRAVREMVRVARKGVMISDGNNIGQGNSLVRYIKYLIKTAGLFSALVWIQTRGKMYKTSEGDGVFYSFSAFDCVDNLRSKFPIVYFMNTEDCRGYNLYRGSPHVMIFARK